MFINYKGEIYAPAILIFAVLELWLIQLQIDRVQFFYIIFAFLLKFVGKRRMTN